eukprot:15441834-Alexandrium_andersonii.AAC.1
MAATGPSARTEGRPALYAYGSGESWSLGVAAALHCGRPFLPVGLEPPVSLTALHLARRPRP